MPANSRWNFNSGFKGLNTTGLPEVSYGYGIRSCAKRKLIFLWSKFVQKRKEVTGGWRKLYNGRCIIGVIHRLSVLRRSN